MLKIECLFTNFTKKVSTNAKEMWKEKNGLKFFRAINFAPVEKNIEFVNKYSIVRFCPNRISGSHTKDITLERLCLRSNLAKRHEKKNQF